MATQAASPQGVHNTGDHNIIVQAQGDGINITVGLPHLTLVPWRSRVRDNLTRDIQILDAAYRAVPLVGRETDMNFLFKWLEGGGITVTTLIGRGGAGKTRLALELLEQMPEAWHAGILSSEEARRFIEHSDLSAWGWQRPTLIVVDYAAALGLTLAAWLRGLADHAPPKHPLRILLLERHASLEGGWYNSLFDPSRQPARVAEFFSPLEPRTLAPIQDAEQRRSVLSSGLARARPFYAGRPAPVVPEPGADAQFDKHLDDEQWADPLLLLMAALVACENGLPAALSLSRPELAKTLADKEARRLRRGLDSHSPQSAQDADLLVHLYACVTLCGGLEPRQLPELMEQECKALRMNHTLGPGGAADTLVTLVGTETKEIANEKGKQRIERVQSMVPDLLAEAFWIAVLGYKNKKPAVARGVEAVKRILPLASDAVIAVLIRSATDFSRAGENLPLAALKAIAESTDADLDLLLAIEKALPQDTLALSGFAHTLTDALVERLRPKYLRGESPDDGALLAVLLNNLSLCQSAVGDRKGALESITEAVRIYRELAASDPDRFLPDLASSLNNQSIQQSAMGDREGALESITEAVRIRSELAASDPDRFLPDLASSLNNLSNRQGDMGDREGALESITEAVRIRRELAASNPDRFLPDLALSLNNLSVQQSDMGDRQGALKSIAEAVRSYRELAASNPDRFLPDLASSLNNLSNRQGDMGDREGALESITEAVRIRRELAASNPDRFLPDLAQSLNNLSVQQSDMGDRQGALKSIAEAVRSYRELAASNPDRFLPDLASSLNNLSNRQGDMGDREGALESITEAVQIRRELSASNPDRFLPDLARSLSVLGDHLVAVGRLREAVESAAESLRILAPFYSHYPEAFRGWAPATVNDYLIRSKQLGLELDEKLLLPYQALIAEYNLRPKEEDPE